jgi:hypothetical protein
MTFINPHEEFCFNTATSFAAVRGRIAAGTRTRKVFSSIDEATAYAQTFSDKKTMIYAINALGNSAHIFNA